MSERMRAARVHVGTEGDHPAVISGESSPMDVSTIVDRIAVRQTTTDSEPPLEAETRRLSSSLHHRRLPKTASAGLGAYDTENRTIEAPQTTQL